MTAADNRVESPAGTLDPPSHNGHYGPAVGVARERTFRELAAAVGRRRWLVVGVGATTFTAVAIWTFSVTPRYQSEARLRIRTDGGSSPLSMLTDQVSSALPSGGSGGGGGSGLASGLLSGFGRDELETEIGVLKSDRVSDAMIDSLALGVRVVSPAESRARILAAVTVDRSVDLDGKLRLSRQSDGTYRTDWSGRDDRPPALPAVIAPGTPVRLGGDAITLDPTLRAAGPSTIRLRILPRYEVHKMLDSRLEIARQEGGSQLVEISYQDPDRTLASQVVNRIVTEYAGYTNGTERGQDTMTVEELRWQVDSTARQLAATEGTLRAFEESKLIIAPQEQAAEVVKRVGAISTKVDAVSTERNALARMLAIIEQRSHGGADPEAYRQLATFPSLITNRAIQDLLQALLDLENKRSELGVRRTDANADYRQLTDRITEIEHELDRVGTQYLEGLDQQLTTTAQTITAIADTLHAMPAAAMQYGRLVRDRTLLETVYISLQKQLKLAELKDVLRQDRVRIIDAPRVANPKDPAFPKKPVMLVLGAVMALALSLAVALAVELWQEPASS